MAHRKRTTPAPSAKPRARKAARATRSDSLAEAGATVGVADLTPAVAANLRQYRVRRGLSLERLAQASGVSRAMLGQIELGQSTPTINVLWKIARALGLPFSALITTPTTAHTRVLRKVQTKVLRSADGTFTSRALFPFGEERNVEFYELRLAPRAVERAESHAPGTVENLIVTRGELEMIVDREVYSLSAGDSIQFEADSPHEYRNPAGEETVMYLVMTYAEKQR